MDLKGWQQNWDELGKDDPLWLVISDPSKAGGKWDVAEFFETGRSEIRQNLDEVARAGITLRFQRALDFGCGVGRLSQALAEKFDEVHGIDISPSMIGHAQKFNRVGEKCRFYISADNGLSMFPDEHFDFVYSSITLQHIEPRFALNYIRAFARVLRPGGAIVFQALSPVFWRSLVPQPAVSLWRKFKHGDKPYIGMFGIPRKKIEDTLTSAGAKVVAVLSRSSDTSRFHSFQYIATKPAKS